MGSSCSIRVPFRVLAIRMPHYLRALFGELPCIASLQGSLVPGLLGLDDLGFRDQGYSFETESPNIRKNSSWVEVRLLWIGEYAVYSLLSLKSIPTKSPYNSVTPNPKALSLKSGSPHQTCQSISCGVWGLGFRLY